MLTFFRNSKTHPITAEHPQTQDAFAETDRVISARGDIHVGRCHVLTEERWRMLRPAVPEPFEAGVMVAVFLNEIAAEAAQ